MIAVIESLIFFRVVPRIPWLNELSLIKMLNTQNFIACVFDHDDYGPWMGRLTGLEMELSELLGRNADVIPKPLLKWVIRDRVLAEAQPIYVAKDR